VRIGPCLPGNDAPSDCGGVCIWAEEGAVEGEGGGEVVQVEGGDVGAGAEVLELVLQGVF
jgi:hypothetical protein